MNLDFDIDRLDVTLKYADGFWLGFVFCTLLEAAVIRERLGMVLASEGARMDVWLPQSADDLRRETLPWIVSAERAGANLLWVALQVDGGARPWEEALEHIFLRASGCLSERIRNNIGCGLIVDAPPSMKSLIREAAPDLWSIRHIVIESEEVRQ